MGLRGARAGGRIGVCRPMFRAESLRADWTALLLCSLLDHCYASLYCGALICEGSHFAKREDAKKLGPPDETIKSAAPTSNQLVLHDSRWRPANLPSNSVQLAYRRSIYRLQVSILQTGFFSNNSAFPQEASMNETLIPRSQVGRRPRSASPDEHYMMRVPCGRACPTYVPSEVDTGLVL